MQTNAQLKQVAQEFTEAALPRLTALTKFFPPEASPDTVAHFLEQAVFTLVQQRLGTKKLVSGVLHNPEKPGGPAEAWLLEGIVHNPQKGPISLQNGRLAIVNPQFCAGLISVKAFAANLAKLGTRLGAVRGMHFRPRPASCVMGVLVRDPQPEKKSWIRRGKTQFHAYDHTVNNWCPVYILFGYSQGKYKPHEPAIEAFIGNIHQNFHPQF